MTTAQWILLAWIVIGLFLYSLVHGKGRLAQKRPFHIRVFWLLSVVILWPFLLLIIAGAKAYNAERRGKK